MLEHPLCKRFRVFYENQRWCSSAFEAVHFWLGTSQLSRLVEDNVKTKSLLSAGDGCVCDGCVTISLNSALTSTKRRITRLEEEVSTLAHEVEFVLVGMHSSVGVVLPIPSAQLTAHLVSPWLASQPASQLLLGAGRFYQGCALIKRGEI